MSIITNPETSQQSPQETGTKPVYEVAQARSWQEVNNSNYSVKDKRMFNLGFTYGWYERARVEAGRRSK